MNGLNIVYLLLGCLAALVTVILGGRQILKKTRSEVEKALSPLADASVKMTEAFNHRQDRGLGFDIDQYAAVEAANKALRTVISDSTTQLSQSAAELARHRELTSQLRRELDAAMADKDRLRQRIETLEREVKELRAKLEYFTNPPQFGTNGEHT